MRRNDAKTVNVISTGVFSSNTNVVVSTLKFFLTVAADDEEDRIAEEKDKVIYIYARFYLQQSDNRHDIVGQTHNQENEFEVGCEKAWTWC